jgi:hypothetical protein
VDSGLCLLVSSLARASFPALPSSVQGGWASHPIRLLAFQFALSSAQPRWPRPCAFRPPRRRRLPEHNDLRPMGDNVSTKCIHGPPTNSFVIQSCSSPAYSLCFSIFHCFLVWPSQSRPKTSRFGTEIAKRSTLLCKPSRSPLELPNTVPMSWASRLRRQRRP